VYVGVGGEKLRRGEGREITREYMTVGWQVPDNLSAVTEIFSGHESLAAGQWHSIFSARQLNSIPVFSVTTHSVTRGCVCVWHSVWWDTQVLYATILSYKVCGSIYYYYSEVTVGTADQVAEWWAQYAVRCCRFFYYCGYLIKHRAGTTIYNHRVWCKSYMLEISTRYRICWILRNMEHNNPQVFPSQYKHQQRNYWA